MSLPLALFFYMVIGMQQAVSFMVTISIFLLLCIGAEGLATDGHGGQCGRGGVGSRGGGRALAP